MSKLKGNRPRPRVALIGDFEENTVIRFATIFPTFRLGSNLKSIREQVGYQEIDLTIIAPDTPLTDDDIRNSEFIENAHVISFSSDFILPGPGNNTSIQKSIRSLTEEFVIPELPLRKHNLLESDLSATESAKGWWLLNLETNHRRSDSVSDDKQREILLNGALIYDPHTKLPFATIFNRLESNLGVAWMPNKIFNIASWVELICNEWAILDSARFPNFGDWSKFSEWMTNEEISFSDQIKKLTIESENLITEYKNRISEAESNLFHSSLLVNNSKRRLITSQGNDLLDEVAQSFKDLGYSVTKVDEELVNGTPKREDLRIQDPDVEEWEAIVEVRGHMKSSGQTSDLNRLPRFAKRYREETGKEPNKLIYVVNGQLEIASPSQRKMPFSAAPEDVKVFGELDGLIIWTLDLFKLLKLVTAEESKAKMRKNIRESVGRWSPD